MYLLQAFIFSLLGFVSFGQSYLLIGSTAPINTVQNVSCTIADTCFRLTEDVNYQQGAVWDLQAIDLSIGFDATFCLYLGSNDSGADGFAFVMRGPGSNSYGNDGGGLGYGNDGGPNGIFPSIAVEFDTYYNPEYNDIPEDHTQLTVNANVDLPAAVSPIPLYPNAANVEDNNFHTTRLVWNPTNYTFSMYFDGNLRFNYTNDIINTVFGGVPLILWGFTASTGGGTNLQQICFPTVDITIDDTSFCENDSVFVHYSYPDLTEYLWTGPNNDTLSYWNTSFGTPLSDTAFFLSEQGNYTLTIEFNNHTYSKTFFVDLIELPFDTSVTYCSNGSPLDLFSLIEPAVDNGTWSGPSVLGNGHLGSFGSTQNDGLYTYSSPSLSVCPFTAYHVDVETVSLNFNGISTLVPCTETKYQLDVAPQMSNGNTNFNYSWTSSSATLASNQESCSANISSNTAVNLSITANDNTGCVFDTSFQLAFISNPPLNIGSDQNFCQGETSIINAPGSWISYLWNTGVDGSEILVSNSGVFWCEVENQQGCVYRDSVLVTVQDPPTFSIIHLDTISCSPLSLNFEVETDPSNSIILQFSNGSLFLNQTQGTMQFTESGNYDLNIVVTNSYQCQSDSLIENAIIVLPTPNASFFYEVVSTNGSEAEVTFTNTSSAYTSLIWNMDDIDFLTSENPIYTFQLANNEPFAELIVTNGTCTDSLVLEIKLPEQILFYIPNSFTPNGDEFNNYFNPIITEGIVELSYHLAIYNRWGELLFESFDPAVGWDATFKNAYVQADTYSWFVNFTEKESGLQRKLSGHVTVIK